MRPAWTGFLLSLSLCLDLGLVNVATLRTALQHGGTAGFVLGIGSAVGDFVYFALSVAGAAALLDWAPVRRTLWLAGTAVLLFLAWRMIREALRPRALEIQGATALRPYGALFASGAGLAIASPSAILWFAAVGGSVIATFGGDRGVLWPFAGGFVFGGVLWSAVLSYGASGFRRAMGTRVVRVMSLASAVLFLYFAFDVFLRGARQLR
jgi:L-lysine exporter family protein LysE/ArgO